MTRDGERDDASGREEIERTPDSPASPEAGAEDGERRHVGPVAGADDEVPADLEGVGDTAARGPGATAPRDRPLGISLLTWLYWFWAGATVIFFLTLIPGDQPVPIGGETMTRSEALARVLPVLVPIGLAAIGGALALSLQRAWARPAVLLPVILAAFGPALSGVNTSTTDTAFGVIILLALLGGLVWYLYFRPKTVAYFERLKDEADG
jgi:hypothetical protein